jgi:hypothetical protein
MKKTFLAFALVLAVSPVAIGQISIDPPPAWTDATALHPSPKIVLFLEGPEGSSFVLTRLKSLDTTNRPVVTTFLLDVVNALNKQTKRSFVPSPKLKETRFDNGVKALFLRAKLNGQQRLILAVANLGGNPFLALLNSSIPDIMFPSTLGAVKISALEETSTAPTLSADDQLEFNLPEDFILRPLSDSNRDSGIVLSIQGLQSSLVVKKINAPDTTDTKDEPAFLKAQIISLSSVDPGLVSPQKILPTAAGPSVLYMSAGVKGEGSLDQVAIGYMPWCYWGYFISAKGPHAANLISQLFQTLSPGPSVLPRLLKETPKIYLPSGSSFYEKEIALGSVFLVLVLFWTRRSKQKKERAIQKLH